MSLLQTIETNSNLPLVLKILGVVIFALSFIASWSHIPLFYKLCMVAGILMFFVGPRFVKIYTPVAGVGGIGSGQQSTAQK